MARPNLVLDRCYYSTESKKRKATVDEAITIRSQTGGFKGECPHCGYQIAVFKASKLQPAHFQHSPLGNGACLYSGPYR